jgi:hypothetical protein
MSLLIHYFGDGNHRVVQWSSGICLGGTFRSSRQCKSTILPNFTIRSVNKFKRIQNINQLPEIQTCTVTYIDHTLQNDIVVPYQPWHLEKPSAENSLDPKFEYSYSIQNLRLSLAARTFQWSRYPGTLRDGVDMGLMGIGGREREVFPAGKPLRPPPLPANYYDWFG